MSWNFVRIGSLLTESKIESLNPNPEKRIRVRLNVKGVEKRPDKSEVEGATKQYLRKANQFIYGKQNFHKGAFGIIPQELDDFESSSDIPSFDVSPNCLPEWIFYFFKDKGRYLQLEKYATGVGSKRISPKKIFDIEIPLPSIEEQKRIIKKIKATEVRVDNLQLQIDNQKTNLKNLRKQILQDAIEGKLTKEWREKNPDIEPASKLLEKIKIEKEKLIAKKKIKKEKPLSEINKNEIPFELPESWVWTRLGEMCYRIHYGFNASAKKEKDGVRLLRITDIQDSKVDWDNVPGCDYSQKDIETYGLNENDIVIARTGGTIGKSFLVKNKIVESLFASYLIRLVPSKLSSSEYIKLFLETPIYWKQLFNAAWGAGQPNVNGSSLQKLFFPLPPLPEQLAIVSKLQTIMQKIDEAEQQIEKSLEYSKQLYSAILSEAFNLSK